MGITSLHAVRHSWTSNRRAWLGAFGLLLALIGGLRTFGFLGLLLGPIILSLFLACYRIYTEGRVTESVRTGRRAGTSTSVGT